MASRWTKYLAAGLFVPLISAPLKADDQSVSPTQPKKTDTQCWSPGELRARSGEEKIRKHVPQAFLVPPERTLEPIQSQPTRNRVLRRVELPQGSKKLVALTFDLCEQPNEIAGYDGAVVDTLREYKVRATFFAGGKWMLSHRQRTQQLLLDPLFEIGNHTWEHRNLRLLSGKELIDEVLNAEKAYEEVRGTLTGQCSATIPDAQLGKLRRRLTLFRFPFGACDKKSLAAVNDAGLTAIQWDVSSSDPTRTLKPERIMSQVINNVKPGSIVLFHANGRGWSTHAALPQIIKELKTRGFEFTTVSELIRAPGARPEYADTCYDNQIGDTDKYDLLARRLDEVFREFKARHQTSPQYQPAREQEPTEVLPWAR